jgi:group I intron endonuclease
MVGIYKITNPNGRVYVGQSVNIEQRIKGYKYLVNCKTQVKLYNSLIKYGTFTHVFEVIEECTEEELNTKERYWQDYYNVLSKKGLNCRLTETSTKSGKNSKESNKKRALTMKGKNRDPRPDVSERNKKIHKGKVITEEHKKRNREKQLGISKPYGGQNENRKKEVEQYSKDRVTRIAVWDSITSAANSVKRGPGDIHRVLIGRGSSCAGYYWKYRDTSEKV